MDKYQEIEIGRILSGEYEQRLEGEDLELDELVESIKRLGVLEPIHVVKKGEKFVVVAGHRRVKAAQRAGLMYIPAIVTEHSEAVQTEITFAENFFRKDLTPVELACAINDCYTNGIRSVKELAAGFHRTEHWVRQMIGITYWPADVLAAVHAKKLSISAAANLALITEKNYRQFLISNAEENGATARTTAAWLQAWQAMVPAKEAITAEPVPPGNPQAPVVPQAPCFCCSQMFNMDQVSHVPICSACIQILRKVGEI